MYRFLLFEYFDKRIFDKQVLPPDALGLDCAVNVPEELKHKFKGRKCQPSKLNSVNEEDGYLNSILKGKPEKRSRIEYEESQTHQTK